MTKQMALVIIAWIGAVGIGFSGYLSYKELFTEICTVGSIYCGMKIGLIAGLPACVYGLVMYSAVFVVACCGLRAKKVK